ncbi:glycoside hydrolase family 30 beta sandwich domain-containing protein [Mucilaginibacter sp. UC70_90]
MKKNMNFMQLMLLAFFATAMSCGKKSDDSVKVVPPKVTPVKTDVTMWLTNPDQTQLLARQNASLIFSSTTNQNTTINVDTTNTYQSIDGFGFCLTGRSATLLNTLPTAQSNALIKELFSTDSTSIGISYLRISIGSSDLSSHTFTYDDQGPDLNLQNFSIAEEQTDLIPVLKKIIAINPNIKILATPWSAPAWMKTNNSLSGGSLQSQYFSVYANYFVKYIQAMAGQGITIDAITPQNEPLNPTNNPSMVMEAADEASFIGNNLGPALQSGGIKTKIIAYDHNCDRPDYPTTVLGNTTAAAFVDGSAFHLYAGDISALSQVHNAYPAKNIYFTEQAITTYGTFSSDLNAHVNDLIVGATRNWSRNVLEWNLASDPIGGSQTTVGCPMCIGALTINPSNITRNVSYYIIAHASKFVRPGAVRIASDAISGLPNVAFKNTDGSKALIVLNNSGSAKTFNIKFKSKIVASTLNNGAVATYVW